MLVNHIQSSCDSIMSSIRSSPLNYTVQETAYSLYVTIRKSTRKTTNLLYSVQDKLSETNFDRENQLKALKSRCEFLENKNLALKNDLEEAAIEIEEKQNYSKCLENKMDVDQSKLEAAVKSLKEVDGRVHNLTMQVEKVNYENRGLKSQNSDLEHELKAIELALKTSETEMKDQEHEFKKKSVALEDIIRNLKEFKMEKIAEEKEFKTKNNKLNKKLKDLEERKLTVEKSLIGRISRNDVKEKEPVFNKDTTEDFNANETILHTVPIKNSFQHFVDLEDEEDQLKACAAFPGLGSRSSVASPPPPPSNKPPGDAPDLSAASLLSTRNTSTSASSGQCELIKTGHHVSTDQSFRKLWKCSFCEQTYNQQNTFDQVYHTRGHQKEY